MLLGRAFPNILKEHLRFSSVSSGPRKIAMWQDEMHDIGVSGETTERPASGGGNVVQWAGSYGNHWDGCVVELRRR